MDSAETEGGPAPPPKPPPAPSAPADRGRWSSPGWRWLAVLGIVLLFFAVPWPSSGPSTLSVYQPTLDPLAPVNTSAIAFDGSNHTIAFSGTSEGAARVDLLRTAYSFDWTASVAVVRSDVQDPSAWHWVELNASVPSGATSFEVALGAWSGVELDVASVRVSDSTNVSDILYEGNGTSSSGPWTLSGADHFGSFGTPSLPALQVAGAGNGLGMARETTEVAIPSTVRLVSVGGLVRFNGTAGPFEIALDIGSGSGAPLPEIAGWSEWAQAAPPLLPLDVMVWTPVLAGSLVLTFEPTFSDGGSIGLELNESGVLAPIQSLGNFTDGLPVDLSIAWDPESSLTVSAVSPGGPRTVWEADSNSSNASVAALVTVAQITVSAGEQGPPGAVTFSTMTNPSVTFPGRETFTALSGSPLPGIVGALALVSMAGLSAPEWLPMARPWVRRLRATAPVRWVGSLRGFARRHAAALLLLAAAIPLYASIATTFGGHPYDQWSFKVWSFSIQQGGIRGLYIQPEFVGDAPIRPSDLAWSTTAFPYGPLSALLFDGLARLLPPLSGFSSPSSLNGSVGVEVEIKTLLGLFTVAAGGALYLGIRRATGRAGLGVVALVLLVLNPAIVFDSVVWGETDSVLYLLFVLFAVTAAYRPNWAMAVAGLAVAFKETGPILLFPAALLVLAPGLALSDRVRRVAIAAAVILVATLPVVWSGLLPIVVLTPYSALFGSFVTGTAAAQPFVSPQTYTVWTLFTGFAGGTGITRLMIPSSRVLWNGLAFSTVGILAFSLSWVGGIVLANRAGGSRSLGFWLMATAFGAITFTALLTGTGSRYYTLAIPGLTGAAVLAWVSRSGWRRFTTLGALVVTSAISWWTMLGQFTYILQDGYLPIRGLGLSENPVSRFVSEWYFDNGVITLGSFGALALVFACALLLRAWARRPDPTVELRTGEPPSGAFPGEVGPPSSNGARTTRPGASVSGPASVRLGRSARNRLHEFLKARIGVGPREPLGDLDRPL